MCLVHKGMREILKLIYCFILKLNWIDINACFYNFIDERNNNDIIDNNKLKKVVTIFQQKLL